MSLAMIALFFILFLTIGYFKYGAWVKKHFDINPNAQTPSQKYEDGIDFIPTKPFYLFAQHFSAIAAAGPIAGPIVACQQFGWLPCLIWISLGVVFIGAVHDFSTLTCSVRHHAHSIADIAREQLGTSAGKAMMGFILIALIYIIVAFADVTAASFVSRPEEMQGLNLKFHPGGAVAWAAISYLLLSMVLGFIEKFLHPPLWLTTIIFVPLTFLVCYLGTLFSEWFIFSHQVWAIFICLYCVVASLLPAWLLLQPRGYLGGFVLYTVLAIGTVGLFLTDRTIAQPIFTGFHFDKMVGSLFPFLFVTIACGACSGFHGLVCSGTTSKQIANEKHLHPIGYGAMLSEGFVALISLGVVMLMAPSEILGLKPGSIYGRGIGEFLSLIIGKEHLPFAITFGAMAFSTFVFDTLDVSTRLGRYLIQELVGAKSLLSSIMATLVVILPAVFILSQATPGSWVQFWTLFGAANQLLAALSLLIISLWLYQSGKRLSFTFYPMLFVLITTNVALVQLAVDYFKKSNGFDMNLINSLMSLLLVTLALGLVLKARMIVKNKIKV